MGFHEKPERCRQRKSKIISLFLLYNVHHHETCYFDKWPIWDYHLLGTNGCSIIKINPWLFLELLSVETNCIYTCKNKITTRGNFELNYFKGFLKTTAQSYMSSGPPNNSKRAAVPTWWLEYLLIGWWKSHGPFVRLDASGTHRMPFLYFSFAYSLRYQLFIPHHNHSLHWYCTCLHIR